MSSYYVDLSANTDGHEGTQLDPYSIKDMLNRGNGNDYYLKGQCTFSDDFYLSECNLSPWDLELYGPWRINFDTQYKQSIMTDAGLTATRRIDGCIIQSSTGELDIFLKGHNCIFICNNNSNFFCNDNEPPYDMTDVTVISDRGITAYNAIWNNCTIDTSYDLSGFLDNSLMVFNDCNITFANEGFNGSGSQYNWTPPTWPAWDAPYEDWKAVIK
jgi:hypothetical protein